MTPYLFLAVQAIATNTLAAHEAHMQVSQDFKLGSAARVSLRSSGSPAKPLPDVGSDGESQRAEPRGSELYLIFLGIGTKYFTEH